MGAANHHIRMISEGSCDTEDWRNDAENPALHQRKLLLLYYILNRIKAAMVSIILSNTHKHKLYQPQTFEWCNLTALKRTLLKSVRHRPSRNPSSSSLEQSHAERDRDTEPPVHSSIPV